MAVIQDDAVTAGKKGEVLAEWIIDKDSTASVALDADAQTMYRMLEGGFGRLQIKHLTTGVSRLTSGLFIKDLLN